METRHVDPRNTHGVSRRQLLKAGLAAGAALSAWPLYGPSALWGEEAGPPKRGGILRVRGRDPVHFDPHLSINVRTQSTLSFVYSKLVRHKVGADDSAGHLHRRTRSGGALGGTGRHDLCLPSAQRGQMAQ